jgi:hypothetical protein
MPWGGVGERCTEPAKNQAVLEPNLALPDARLYPTLGLKSLRALGDAHNEETGSEGAERGEDEAGVK